MSPTTEPNPPSRKQESFPKTTTLPEGWNAEALMNSYNSPVNEPCPGSEHEARGAVQCQRRSAPEITDETLFSRRLDPFPKPNTIPGGWDTSEWYV